MDRFGTEARPGPERGPAVPGHAKDGGFDISERLDVGQAGVGARACEPWSLESVPGFVHESSRVAFGGDVAQAIRAWHSSTRHSLHGTQT